MLDLEGSVCPQRLRASRWKQIGKRALRSWKEGKILRNTKHDGYIFTVRGTRTINNDVTLDIVIKISLASVFLSSREFIRSLSHIHTHTYDFKKWTHSHLILKKYISEITAEFVKVTCKPELYAISRKENTSKSRKREIPEWAPFTPSLFRKNFIT